MSVKEELERAQYVLILVKKILQRPDFVASKYGLKMHPHLYPYRFITVHKFDKIPENFFEVYNIILKKGRQVDGTPYGNYYLTLHGRGKKFGQYNPKEAKYRAGCDVIYDASGIKFANINCSHPAFVRLLASALPFMSCKEKVK